MAVGAQPKAVGGAGSLLLAHSGVVPRAARRCSRDVGRLAYVLVLVLSAGVRPEGGGSAVTAFSSRALVEDLYHARREVVSPARPRHARHFRTAGRLALSVKLLRMRPKLFHTS